MPRRTSSGPDGRDQAAPGPPAATLGAVIERLQPAVVDVLAAPAGLDRAVSGPVLLDPAEPVPPLSGAIVLALAVDGERARIAAIRQAADAGATAVALKLTGGEPEAERVRAAAADAGIAVLAVPRALSWGQLYTLLLTAATAGPAEQVDLPEAPLGDLFALANAIAAAVGGATTIEDPHNRVLAYSNLGHRIDQPRQETILGRQVPTEWIQRLHDAGTFRRLWGGTDVVRVAEFAGATSGYLSRVAVPVRAGGELLGSIWVIEGEQPLSPEAEQSLRDAADIAALHLLRHRSAGDVRRQRRAASLLGLLDGTESADQAAAVLHLHADQPVTVLAFAAGSADDDAAGVAAGQRVADLIAVYCESYRRQAACAATGTRVYVLLPGDEVAAVRQLAEAIVSRAGQALRLQVRAGIGSPVPALGQAVRSRDEADQVLDVLDTEAPPVATIDDVRPRVILHRLAALARQDDALLHGRVQELAAQDREKGTAWVATLRAYFDAYGDMAAAAAAVNVHPNTFRYRLRRIGEVFGLDLTNPDERLVAELQLRFLATPQVH